MPWSSQAAVVTGGQLTLPVTGQQLASIPIIRAASNGQSTGLLVGGPGLAQSNNQATMSITFWSDTAGGSLHAPAPGGAHIDIDYFDGLGGGALVAQFDIAGLLVPPTGNPTTPASGCYIFYAGGTLWAKGPSGTAVALATT